MISKILLFPYYLFLKTRHALYDAGIRKSHGCEVPTICLGNITAGGTGKTPHTEMILRTLLESPEWKDRNLAVLSRGHKRKSRGFQQVMCSSTSGFAGDEPLQIKKKFPAVTVAVDRDRVQGCRYLCRPDLLATDKKARKCQDKDLPAADLVILDDAFQHRSLRSYLNIVLIDYNRPVQKDNLLPIGRLRDLPERLDAAQMLIVTKCPDYLDEWERNNWIASLGIRDFNYETCTGVNRKGTSVTVLFTTIRYCPPTPVFGEGDPRYIYSKKLVLFTGIAKDTPLQKYLSDSYSIVRHFQFADHHKYKKGDLRKISSAVQAFPTAVVATTEKDSQRLRDFENIPLPLKERLFQVPIEISFLSEKEQKVFKETLIRKLQDFNG